MPKIVIIADDLTGAADCAAAFAQRGLEAVILTGWRGVRAAKIDGVLAIDADTRCVGPEQAADAVAKIVEWLGASEASPFLLFKKVDSTLRGNVAAELAAALRARRSHASRSERVPILFAPAFPAQGRTTVNGRQLVNGRPLEETDSPRGARADIAESLREGGLSCGLIELALVRAGGGALRSAMMRTASEVDVVVCDAETEYDLRAIADAGVALSPTTVWAGSAGLARHIPDAFGLGAGPQLARGGRPELQGPILFVIGSPSAVSRQQAQALSMAADVACFSLPSAIVAGEEPPYAAEILDRMRRGQDVLVVFDAADKRAPGDGWALAQWMARAVQPCAQHVGALVATGGETALAVLDAWDVQCLRVLGEVEPGLPYSVAECAGRNLLVLTKAGGFGGPDTLLRSRTFIRQFASNREVSARKS
jgi:uncharacterized protein YgbK (DUF1537 family)